MQNVEMEKAYDRAMKTWAKWIEQNDDMNKTRALFRSTLPEHKGNLWCHNVTKPTLDGSYDTTFPKSIAKITKKTIQSTRTPVKNLNITRLSKHRRDGHPTVYTTKQAKLLTDGQRKKPEVYADCSHYCLPGMPDTWNRLLYAFMGLDCFKDGLPLLTRPT